MTGGTGAIGKETCMKLLAKGCIVYISGRTENKIEEVISRIPEAIKNRGIVCAMVMDVSNAESIEDAFNSVIEEARKFKGNKLFEFYRNSRDSRWWLILFFNIMILSIVMEV